jgi:S-adenosylmethionine:tRNA ribosyltransferase-isomerase
MMQEMDSFQVPDIPVSRFQYDLPESAIAQEPLPERDQSRLLQFRSGQISHHVFKELPGLLEEPALLVFNDTRVIPARLWFYNKQGVRIEIFLLKELSHDETNDSYIWECMVGNRRKFKEGETLSLNSDGVSLQASWYDRENNKVSFRCSGRSAFLDILEAFGHMPLPPYIKREDNYSDQERYQTVFARNAGAVAAPTASLHFTESVLSALAQRGHSKAFLTLHVGAGTFKPVTSEGTAGHLMHTESFSISKETLLALEQAPRVIAVGTTVMRVLESLYYAALRITEGKTPVRIEQHDPYRLDLPGWSLSEVLRIILAYLEREGLSQLEGETSIFIMPGMKFRICSGLITNFHQPGSTLLMLVEAFIGPDWRGMYAEALGKGYRMLSYGDSSLLVP